MQEIASGAEPADYAPADHAIVVVGGGAAGIAVAARLRRLRRRVSIAIVEPSELHAYQPGWTLVGAGRLALARTMRPQQELIPPRVSWIRSSVTRVFADERALLLEDGRRIVYGWLVICPGLTLQWDRIDGLRETLGRNDVCSLYSPEGAAYSWSCIRRFVGGVALFTQPTMPIKAPDAAMSLQCLAADHWRRGDRLQHSRIRLCLAGAALFDVPAFVPALQQAIDRYGIEPVFGEALIAIDGPAHTALFLVTDADGTTRTLRHKFDMIHVTPPQGPPDFIRRSGLADAQGWLAVDPASLRHLRHERLFGLGDAIGTGNAKTLGAVRMQVPVVVRNLLAALDGKPMPARYDGYGSCPVMPAPGRVILAEFGYDGGILSSLAADPRIPSRRAWWLTTWRLPRSYWNRMLRGRKPWRRPRPRRLS